jgi:dienelactone hydrolase
LAACRSGPDGGVFGPADPPLVARDVPGAEFVHTVFEAGASSGEATRALFVYLEGDGRPWSDDGMRPASNPDPVRSVARELAAIQPSGSLLLGRPCYHDRVHDPGCAPEIWTSARYSDRVVASMVAALRRLIDAEPNRQPVVLVGYSGGGALALLIADRVAEVRAVVTLAANLDLSAWSDHHGYLPLAGSLDPLATRALPPGCEIHIAAERDSVVPPSLVRSAATRRPGALLWIEPRADHACCWRSRWTKTLERVARQLDSADCVD